METTSKMEPPTRKPFDFDPAGRFITRSPCSPALISHPERRSPWVPIGGIPKIASDFFIEGFLMFSCWAAFLKPLSIKRPLRQLKSRWLELWFSCYLPGCGKSECTEYNMSLAFSVKMSCALVDTSYWKGIPKCFAS